MRGGLIAATWSEAASGLGWAIFWFAVIFALLALAVALARRYRENGTILKSLRDNNAQDSDDPGELLTKFRELHSRGTLSDKEYRTIKTKLASQIQAGLGENVKSQDG